MKWSFASAAATSLILSATHAFVHAETIPDMIGVEAVTPATEQITPREGENVVWLVLRGGLKLEQVYFTIPTSSFEQCEMSGAEFVASKRLNSNHSFVHRGFECLEGIR